MIMIRLMGGLGNQMFQYAFGRSLSLKYNTELVLDHSLLLDKSSDHKVTTHRDYDLDIFPSLKFRKATGNEVFLFNGDSRASFFKKAMRRIRLVFNPKDLKVQKHNKIEPGYFEITRDTCFAGRWQSYKFFEDHVPEIKNDFRLEKPGIKGINAILDQINETNSICLHVRRGDLVTSPVYTKVIGALDLSYYKTAIEKMNRLEKNCTFFIFSDDVEWCRQNINIKDNQAVFVDKNLAGKKAEGHLFLMSQCRHFIISNSTYAWWAAFMSGNPEKKVIYPENWYREKSLENPDMCPPSWIKLNQKLN